MIKREPYGKITNIIITSMFIEKHLKGVFYDLEISCLNINLEGLA